jgi:dienelactone hydrolase
MSADFTDQLRETSKHKKLICEICVHLWLVLGAAIPICAQTPALEAGKVIDRVIVRSHPDQSYAAFLPKSYTPDKRWPIVFCLDPRARGRIAIDRFTEAADELGYIVVCSNNSRNGLDWQTISNIFTDFWDDAHARFSIDEKRTYAAGFSGGSRLASAFASRCKGCLAGVIGCGAGFSPDIQPDANTHFSYFGIAGVDDFNFSEMWELEKTLSKLNAPFRFETFLGGHEWPPAASIRQAMAWFALQSMKAGATARDEAFLDKNLTERMALAEKSFAEQRPVDAYKAFLSIARDFTGLRDSDMAREKAQRLRESADYKKEVKTEEDSFRRQLREVGEIRMDWFKQPDADSAGLPRHETTLRISEWRNKKESTKDSSERRLARRIVSQILISSIEESQASLRKNDYNVALANLELAHEVDQKNANVVFEIARIYALKREKKSAMQFLEQAVSLGFKDVARLKAENAFSTVVEDPRYQKILATLEAQ